MKKNKHAKKQENQPVTTFVFEPVAQNTVIRPMAQAVCIARGGETVPYTDTATHKEKSVALSDLYFLTLSTKADDRMLTWDGYQVALIAQHTPVQICVDVNDVQVFITRDTTVEQAMADFHQKITPRHDYFLNREPSSRQHE